MNREYENPEMEIIRFDTMDVIKTSGDGWVDDPIQDGSWDTDDI